MRENSQEVGSEAAILQRVRNSSLVECMGADNVPRLKYPAEAVDLIRRDWIYHVRKDRIYHVRAMRW